MMFCPNCGSQINDTSKFCDRCGAKIEDIALPAADPGAIPAAPLTESRPTGKRPARKTVAIVCICLAVVLAAGGVAVKAFFARDFLQMVYGEEKYSKKVEQAAVQAAGSGTVSFFSGLSQTAAEQKKDRAYEQKQKFEISFDDAVRQMIDGGTQRDGVADKVTKYANSLNFSNTCNHNGGQTQMGLTISDGSGNLLSAAGFSDGNNKGFYQLPEISKTYFRTEDIMTDPSSGAVLRNFSYDEKQFSSSMDKLTEIWQKAIDEGETSIEKDDEISVRDVSANAEKVTVTLDGDQLAGLSEDLITAVRDDDYLYSFLSDNDKALIQNGSGFLNAGRLSFMRGGNSGVDALEQPLEKSGYRDFLDGLMASAKNISDNVREISFSSYITPKNKMVGQSFEISFKNSNGGPSKADLNYVTEEKGKSASKALNFTVDGKEYFYTTLEADSQQSGDLILMLEEPASSQSVGLKVEYSDYKKDKFMGMPVYLGKYSVSLQDSQSVLEKNLLSNVYDSSSQQLLKDLTRSTVSVTNSLDGKKLNTSLDVSLKGIGQLKISQATEEKNSEKITLPNIPRSESINISAKGIADGQDQLSKDYQKSTLEYLSGLLKSHPDFSGVLSEMNLTQENIDSALKYY